MGIFLNKFPNIQFPLIRLMLINLDFNLMQISQLPMIYGLLFLVILPLIFFDFVISLQDKQKISIIYYNLY